MRKLQPYLAMLMALAVAAPPTVAQQNNTTRDAGWYSRLTDRYISRDVPPINLANSGRLDALLRAGRLYLSLQDAVALALENNLDVELQRYGPRLAEADLLRARAGGVTRGIPTSISQGPSSASSLAAGGGAGTGVAGAGGPAGGGGGGTTGANNATVVFTGTQVPSLDEVAFVNYTWGHRTSVQSNTITTGTSSLVFQGGQLASGIQKSFLTGTQVVLGYNQQGQVSNSTRAEINPVRTGNMNLQITQPLLQGFGIALNSRFIRIARNDVKISDLVFRQQVIAAVATVVNLYSDLVSFNEDVKVRSQALNLAEKLYNDNKKQVEIGTLAPIEIVRAEAEVARSQQELTQAETQVLQQETVLKNYLSRTGLQSPSIAEARIVPTDRLRIPDVEQVQPVQDLVAAAIQKRPELAQTQLQIENAKISLTGSKSQLLPSLNVIASATNNGLAGQNNVLFVPTPVTPGQPLRPSTIDPQLLGGLGGVWSQILGRNFPDYSLGFQLSIPLRNRTAQADITRDQLTLRQSELRQRQELNQIRVDVQNALIGLQQSRSRYQAAQKSRVLQEQTLDAEQKKYALGASTIFFVIQAQRDLAQAQAVEVASLSTYNRALVALRRATGEILEAFNVSVDEALQGRVGNPPSPLPAVDEK